MRNACRLHDRHALPAFGKGGRIERITQLGRHLLCTEERDVLLTEGEIDRGKRVEGGQFARVDLNQTNMRHRSSDQVGLSHRDMLFFLALLALLVHQGATPARTAIRHSLHQGNEPSNRPFPPLRNLFFYVVCKAAIRFSGSTPLKEAFFDVVLPFGPVAKIVIICYYTLVTSSKQLDTLCALRLS